jgi:hypothetical protein
VVLEEMCGGGNDGMGRIVIERMKKNHPLNPWEKLTLIDFTR